VDLSPTLAHRVFLIHAAGVGEGGLLKYYASFG
jgi:hypothetical protein